MKKSVTQNYIYNLMFQILTVIFPIITTPYLARILGAEQIGIFSYTFSIVTYFVLFSSLGINLYGQREVAYVQDDKEKRSKVFFELICVRIVTTTIALIIFLTFAMLIKEYKIYYYLWTLELVASLFDISWYFQGIEQFKKIIFRNLIVKILSFISIFLFVKNSNDLNIYILIYALTTFIGNISLWFYLPNSIDFKLTTMKNFHKIGMHIKSLVILFVPQIATKVYTVLDKTMIGTIVIDKIEVGYYEQSQKIVYLLLTILTSLGTVLMPRIASYFSQNNKEIYKSYNFVFMIGLPLMFGSILSSKYLIPIYLGSEYEKSILLMQILSPIILFVGLSNVSGIQLLIPLKRQKQYNYSIIAGAIVNFILNIFFIKYLSSVGAAITTVTAEFIILIIQLVSIKDIINIKKVFKNSINYWIASIGMLVFCYISINLLNLNNYIMLILLGTFGVSSYFLLLLLLRDKYLTSIFTYFKSRKKHNEIFDKNIE